MNPPKSNRSIPCYCINTRRAANAITAYYDKALKPCGVTVSQFSLLWSLSALESSNVTKLAAQLGLERSTVVRNLKPLLKKGHIHDTAENSTRDRRLFVTPKGKVLVELGVPLWRQAQEDIKRHVGEEDIKIFRKVISELQEI